MSVKETVKQAQKVEKPNGQSFGNAIDMGDMSEQGVKAADNLCATFYHSFNQRMEANLSAMRSHLSSKTILIPAAQKSLPSSEGSFMDQFFIEQEVIHE
jgi:hypothetical protein